MSEPLLRIDNLVGGYGKMTILQGVSLEVEEGERVCIIGPNGAGKSTLLRSILGLLTIRSGHIVLDGQEVVGKTTRQIVHAGVGFVPQDRNIFPSLTVRENLELGGFGRPGSDLGQSLDSVYRTFPVLEAKATTRAGNLSGGEQRMLAISRALMVSPRLLLLDEPSGGLAPLLIEETFRKIREVNGMGVTILMVEQNAKQALEMCHRGYVLEMGRERFTGSGADLLRNEQVVELYLGGA